MFHSSYVELSRSALKKNIRYLRDFVGYKVHFSSVIKGNAYGHRIESFLPLAEECGIRHFSVFSADEALQAYRSRTEDSQIMIMGMVEDDALEWAIENELSFYVFELSRLNDAVKAASKTGKPARVHLQMETGMNRIGFETDQLPQLAEIVKNNRDQIVVEGLCTHYAGAENISNYFRIQNQIRCFNEIYSRLEQWGIRPRRRHSACSAAALTYPDTIMDLVRFGIAHYGFWPSRETYMHVMKNSQSKLHKDPLDRVLSWKSVVMSTKNVDSGEFIGYGNTFLTSRPQKIATVPIGYSHGFARNLTNMGRVLIRGERAPVAGLVNMNMLTVDVTDLPEVKKGDEVVVIGKQKDKEITVSSFSEMSNNHNYETLTRLPSTLPRYIVE